MAPVNWASSGRVKIERAKEHIANLEAEITAFKKRRPYEAVPEKEAETGDMVWRAVVREEPPLPWAAIAGDAIHNLRSPLDLLWRQVRAPNASPDARTQKFLLFSSEKAIESCFAGKHQRRDQPVVDALKAAKAYKGGNEYLKLLMDADDINQHRLLIPANAAVGSTIMDSAAGLRSIWRKKFPDRPVDFPPMPIEYLWTDPICPVQSGTVLHRIRAGIDPTQEDMNPKFPYEVAFAETEILKGKPIVPTLNHFLETVESIAEAFLAARLLT